MSLLLQPKEGVRLTCKYFDDDVRPAIRKVLEADAQPSRGVFTVHCGSTTESETILFASLLMKALCDGKRMEDVRLVFALILREFNNPPLDVFNAMLMAISWGDTFTADEVDNILDIMKERAVQGDVTTSVCVMQLRLRLNQLAQAMVEWPVIVEGVKAIISGASAQSEPLSTKLSVKLSQLFTTIVRTVPNPDIHFDYFDLLCALQAVYRGDVGGHIPLLPIKHTLLLLSLSLSNAAVTAGQLRRVVRRLIDTFDSEREAELAKHSGTIASEFESNCALPEATAFRLLARCIRDGEIDFAIELWNYAVLDRKAIGDKALFAVGIVQILANRITATPQFQSPLEDCHAPKLQESYLTMFSFLEAHCTAASTSSLELGGCPAARVPIAGETDRFVVVALSTAPLGRSLVGALTVADGKGIDVALAALGDIDNANERSKVTLTTCNLLLAACASLTDEARARKVFALVRAIGLKPNADCFSYLVASCGADCNKAECIVTEMSCDANGNLAPNYELLRSLLKSAVERRHTSDGLRVVAMNRRYKVSLDSALAAVLVRQLCHVVNLQGARTVLTTMEATNTSVDLRLVKMCDAASKKWALSSSQHDQL